MLLHFESSPTQLSEVVVSLIVLSDLVELVDVVESVESSRKVTMQHYSEVVSVEFTI